MEIGKFLFQKIKAKNNQGAKAYASRAFIFFIEEILIFFKYRRQSQKN